MVPDDFKLVVAGDLQKCNHIACGFVCDGVQTSLFDWEAMHSLKFKWLTPAATDPIRAHVDCSLSCVSFLK